MLYTEGMKSVWVLVGYQSLLLTCSCMMLSSAKIKFSKCWKFMQGPENGDNFRSTFHVTQAINAFKYTTPKIQEHSFNETGPLLSIADTGNVCIDDSAGCANPIIMECIPANVCRSCGSVVPCTADTSRFPCKQPQ
jgi:hypothetical protein